MHVCSPNLPNVWLATNFCRRVGVIRLASVKHSQDKRLVFITKKTNVMIACCYAWTLLVNEMAHLAALYTTIGINASIIMRGKHRHKIRTKAKIREELVATTALNRCRKKLNRSRITVQFGINGSRLTTFCLERFSAFCSLDLVQHLQIQTLL